MADNVTSSPQKPGGPTFETKEISPGIHIPANIGPRSSTTINQGGNLINGTKTLAAVAKFVDRVVQNNDIAPLTLTFGSTGRTVILGAASVLGEQGGTWSMLGGSFYDGDIVLTSTIASAQYSAGCDISSEA